LRFIQEGVRHPPPTSALPIGFTLAPSYAASWGTPTR
jgi:hypothetical protein